MTDDRRGTVRRGYDALAADYAAARNADSAAGALDALFARLDGGRVLDVGCGDGRAVLTRAPGEAVGVDISREQCRLARGNAPRAGVVQGEMTRLPVRTGAVDAVTALHSTIHLPIDDHPAAYREFARVLRPGGWLLVTVSETAWTGRNDDWLDAGVEMRWSYPDEADSRAALADAGFEVVDRRLDDGSLADETWPVLLARLAGR